MRQKAFIVFGLLILIVILVGLNALSYRQEERAADSEAEPNRSSYNTGSTGTRAFFDLLGSSGREVVRWQRPPSELRNAGRRKPSVFVIVGRTRREFTTAETQQVLDWVQEGGLLVVFDRHPELSLIRTTTPWSMLVSGADKRRTYLLDPANTVEMTKDVDAFRPVQPTRYTRGVTAVQPSLLNSTVNISYAGVVTKDVVQDATGYGSERLSDHGDEEFEEDSYGPPPMNSKNAPTPRRDTEDSPRVVTSNREQPPPPLKTTPLRRDDTDDPPREVISNREQPPPPLKTTPLRREEALPANKDGVILESAPIPKPSVQATTTDGAADDAAVSQNAPVVHVAGGERNLVVDAPYGAGRIVIVGDPYLIANNGIGLVDNAVLAMNIVQSKDGVIAFDEYHQGFGANDNRILEFFAGTPVVPVFIQVALLIGFVFLSQSRRFARPVPEPEPDRLSKLEYVGAMAELQRRTNGFDLALENIFGDFKRRVGRAVGVDPNTVKLRDLAFLIHERLPDDDVAGIESLLTRATDIIHGDRTNRKEIIALATKIRELEAKLGLSRAKRARTH